MTHLLCLFGFLWTLLAVPIECQFALSVIHLNDFHARFEETNQLSSACKGVDCIGGISRVYSIVTQLKKERPNAIFLNAGDNFLGTPWYTLYKYKVVAHFLNMLPTDAYTLGNHEFDDKIDGLVPFMKAINAPFVVSNIGNDPRLNKYYKKGIVIRRNGGIRIGIVGCITVRTKKISSPEGLKFLDESKSVNMEARRLVAKEKADTIIVLSHAGYDVDMHIAKNAAPKIGLIVGGHSHTFLFTGKNSPGPDHPEGPYPTVVNHADGRKILITQASSFTKYVGNITVFYDRNEAVSRWSGAPIYLNKDIPQDKVVEEEVRKWKVAVDKELGKVVGVTNRVLSNLDCPDGECALGNLVTDSMAFSYPRVRGLKRWHHTPIGLTVAKGLKASIAEGNVTMYDVASCLPYKNAVYFAEVQGKHIRRALEHCARVYHPRYGNFMQVSGLRVMYNVTKPAGSRIIRLKARRNKSYVDLADNEDYRVAVPSHIANRKDDFAGFGKGLRNRKRGPIDVDVLARYITTVTPLPVKKNRRIQVVT